MKKRIILAIILIAIILMGVNISKLKAAENTKSVIYFYSKTCSTCTTAEKFLDEKEKSGKIFLLKFENAKYPNLRKEFDTAYGVSDALKEQIPMVFIGKQYLSGNAIEATFDSVYKSIEEKDKNAAMNFLLDSKNYASDAAKNKTEEQTQNTSSRRKVALSISILALSGIILLLAFVPKKKKDLNKD